jgi:hypothetical protein
MTTFTPEQRARMEQNRQVALGMPMAFFSFICDINYSKWM